MGLKLNDLISHVGKGKMQVSFGLCVSCIAKGEGEGIDPFTLWLALTFIQLYCADGGREEQRGGAPQGGVSQRL